MERRGIVDNKFFLDYLCENLRESGTSSTLSENGLWVLGVVYLVVEVLLLLALLLGRGILKRFLGVGVVGGLCEERRLARAPTRAAESHTGE